MISNIDGLVQGCSISIPDALEILQSYTKPSICIRWLDDVVLYFLDIIWLCSFSTDVTRALFQYPTRRLTVRFRRRDWYRQVSNISRTYSQHLKDSRTVLRLSLPNPLKPDVKSRMKM